MDGRIIVTIVMVIIDGRRRRFVRVVRSRIHRTLHTAIGIGIGQISTAHTNVRAAWFLIGHIKLKFERRSHAAALADGARQRVS